MNTSPPTPANHRAKECPPHRRSTGPDPPAADGSSADGPNLRARAAVIMAILLVLFVLSQYNYLFFHSVAELFAIAVGWGVFMLVWSARRFVRSEALVFLGTAYLFIGLIDLVHTLAYKGMGVFPAHLDANPATQLWIAARAMESLSLLVFAVFLDKALNPFRALFCFAAITAVILAAVFVWPVFPACYVTGSGLTPFKKISEYVICLILDRIKLDLPGDVYFIKTLPVLVQWQDLVAVCGSAVFICFLATIYPSWEASKMIPVRAIRDE